MKNEALEVLYNRRSIRKFRPEQIKDEELDAVLKAGIYAPTAMGRQTPLIVSVQNKDDIKAINELSGKISGRENPYYCAPTIILIFATQLAMNERFGIIDASSVCTNMVNAAYAAGLGSCWIHIREGMFESEEGQTLLKKLGINEKVTGIASIALGYSDMPQPEPKPRREGYVLKIK